MSTPLVEETVLRSECVLHDIEMKAEAGWPRPTSDLSTDPTDYRTILYDCLYPHLLTRRYLLLATAPIPPPDPTASTIPLF